MSQNRNNPRRPRYRNRRRHSKWFQEFLDRESARLLGNETRLDCTVVDENLTLSATVSGSVGPYRIIGVPPDELRSHSNFYLRAVTSGTTDLAEVYQLTEDLALLESKVSFAVRDMSPAFSVIDLDNDLITLSSHGFETGDGPIQLLTDDTLPAGLADSTDYWIYVENSSQLGLALDLDGAVSGTGHLVNITNSGTGNHELDLAFKIGQDVTAAGIVTYMGRGVSRERIRTVSATATGIADVFGI